MVAKAVLKISKNSEGNIYERVCLFQPWIYCIPYFSPEISKLTTDLSFKTSFVCLKLVSCSFDISVMIEVEIAMAA